ncbi:hypothetical protein VMT65_08350 [Nocardia sp. CDC153]|uniref:hypothetical protein n=1 Tax=Nocardia sp. CDC153 TaxID=3112167 RepID=UPI002DBD525D|nr:hypothetical protein [Nocardia sp. CDC153]MEC3953037.1 hypothetical protein [Nocardia sp. CDC153]
MGSPGTEHENLSGGGGKKARNIAIAALAVAGDDCSHDGIVAHWGHSPAGLWICIPQDQGNSAEPYTPVPPAGEPGAN